MWNREFLLVLSLVLGCAPCPAFSSSQYRRSATFSSSPRVRPWRQDPSSFPRTSRSSPSYAKDYSRHFLEEEDWIHDRRARIYTQHRPSRVNQASVTTRLNWINILTYITQMVRPSVTAWGIKISDKILAGQELHRIVTPMFLHGNLIHLYMNMRSLMSTGPTIEEVFGPGRFLATYLVSGVCGNLLSAVMSPSKSLGASGAVFGVISAYYVFLSRLDWMLGAMGERMSTSIATTLLTNVAFGFMMPTIDNYGHLGGALGGALMAYYFGPRLYYGGVDSDARVLVDIPICRLPPLPLNLSRRLRRMSLRMQVDRHKLDMPDKPWRQQTPPPGRGVVPNRSVKPRRKS